MMNIAVDFDKCQSNAVCMQFAPSIFEVRDDGYLYVLNEHPDESLHEVINLAAANCPTQAITVSQT